MYHWTNQHVLLQVNLEELGLLEICTIFIIQIESATFFYSLNNIYLEIQQSYA